MTSAKCAGADGGAHVAADEHDAIEGRAFDQVALERRVALGRGDQHAHVAVAEDVADLRRFQDRVDRHERQAGARRAEHRDDGLELLRQEHGDPVLYAQAARDHRPAELLDLGRDLLVGILRIPVDEGSGLRCLPGLAEQQLVE